MELPKIYNTYFLAIISTIGGMLYVLPLDRLATCIY